GIDRIEGERRLARAREPGEYDQLVARNLDVDILEVVLARAADRNHAAVGLVSGVWFVERVVHRFRISGENDARDVGRHRCSERRKNRVLAPVERSGVRPASESPGDNAGGCALGWPATKRTGGVP